MHSVIYQTNQQYIKLIKLSTPPTSCNINIVLTEIIHISLMIPLLNYISEENTFLLHYIRLATAALSNFGGDEL